MEYIILGIKNGQYQAAMNLAQDCIDELGAQPESPDGEEKPLRQAPEADQECTCHPHDLAYYGCRCKRADGEKLP